MSKILGISLFVEEVGKGAYLVFKYPLSPPSPTATSSNNTTSTTSERSTTTSHNNSNSSSTNSTTTTTTTTTPDSTSTSTSHHHNTNDTTSSNTSQSNDLLANNVFFTVPSRVMAKLFRTKPSLCGQPMTLSIGGTIFCCRSVLLNPISDHSNSLISSSQQQQQHSGSLVLFSIVVAILPNTSLSSTTLLSSSSSSTHNLNTTIMYEISRFTSTNANNNNSNNNFMTQNHRIEKQRQGINNEKQSTQTKNESKNDKQNETTSATGTQHTSKSFPTVRKVHISLARLCKVLEREEKRCFYVTRQVAMLMNIQNNFSSFNQNTINNNNDVSNNNNHPNPLSNDIHASSSSNNNNNNHFRSSTPPSIPTSTIMTSSAPHHKRFSSVPITSDVLNSLPMTQSTTPTTRTTPPPVIPSSSTTPSLEFKTDVHNSNVNSTTTTNNSNNVRVSSTNNQQHYMDLDDLNHDEKESIMEQMLASPPPKPPDDDDNNNNMLLQPKQQQQQQQQQYENNSSIGITNDKSQPEDGVTQPIQGDDTIIDTSATSTKSAADNVDQTKSFLHTNHREHSMINRAKLPLFGNLAKELAETYHALSRHELEFQPSPTILLTSRDSLVYINRHIVVPIESSSSSQLLSSSSFDKDALSDMDTTILKSARNNLLISNLQNSMKIPPSSTPQVPHLVRPYHTLLFPYASPMDILKNILASSTTFNTRSNNDSSFISSHMINSSSSIKSRQQRKYSESLMVSSTATVATQRLEKLLLVADPFKSLKDIAADATLPLSTTLDLASSLVHSGSCIVVPSLRLSTRFACQYDAIKKIQTLSLSFAQNFGHYIPISFALSVLTTEVPNEKMDHAMNISLENYYSALHWNNNNNKSMDGTEKDDADDAEYSGEDDDTPRNISNANVRSTRNNNAHLHERKNIDSSRKEISSTTPISIGELLEYCKIAFCEESSLVQTDDEMIPKPFHADKRYNLKNNNYNNAHRHPYHANAIPAVDTVPENIRLLINRIVMTLQLPRLPMGFHMKQSETCLLVEDALIAIAVWLRSHCVIIELKEYWTLINNDVGKNMTQNNEGDTSNSVNFDEMNRLTSNFKEADLLDDTKCETLYKMFLTYGVMANGNISVDALAWYFGLRHKVLRKFKEWGLRKKKLHVVNRIPGEGDDWMAP